MASILVYTLTNNSEVMEEDWTDKNAHDEDQLHYAYNTQFTEHINTIHFKNYN
jgi:hypothetical protein